MIIQIAGTNGAGKSTVMRKLAGRMELLTEHHEYSEYRCLRVDDPVWVLGRYEEGVATGGADKLRSIGVIQELMLGGVLAGAHVLWEGASSHGGLNQTKGPEFLARLDVSYVVVLLTTPLGVCLEGVAARRAERGEGALMDDQHVRGNLGRAQHYAARMRDAGARVVRVSREDAVEKILEILVASG